MRQPSPEGASGSSAACTLRQPEATGRTAPGPDTNSTKKTECHPACIHNPHTNERAAKTVSAASDSSMTRSREWNMRFMQNQIELRASKCFSRAKKPGSTVTTIIARITMLKLWATRWQIAEEETTEDEEAHPHKITDDVVQKEGHVIHFSHTGDKRRKSPHDRDKAGKYNGSGAVPL